MNADAVSAGRVSLVAACHHLAAAGLSPGATGNVSVLLDGALLLVTPTGTALRRVTAATVVGIDPSGAVAFGGTPTKEALLHRAVYDARPTARAVVHLHSPHATAVSCLTDTLDTDPLPPLTVYHRPRLGDVPLVPTAPPGSVDLAQHVAAAARTHHAMLLAHHGSLTAADTLDTAVDLAEELELAAQIALLTAAHHRHAD